MRRQSFRPTRSLRIEALEVRSLLSVSMNSIPLASAAAEAHALKPEFKLHRQAGDLATGSANPVGLTPSQIRKAYGFDQIQFGAVQGGAVQGDGTGQTIAIIDAYDAPNIVNDLHVFDQAFGLPDPPSFNRIPQNGRSTLPRTDPSGAGNANGTWEMETSLDVEWAHALAPNANILLVEARSSQPIDLFTAAITAARNQADVSVVSMSFGATESVGDAQYNTLFTTPTGHIGMTFVAASGDSGAPGLFPAYSPNVLAAGGTSLTLDVSGNYSSESGWSGSGGGISKYETQPAFQNGVATQSSTMRTMPDVAFDSDPYTGVTVYDSWDFSANGWVQFGGTSYATPAWSALIAIANQGRATWGGGALDGVSQTLPMLYHLPSSAFNDVTSGSNPPSPPISGVSGFNVGPGYDLVTGLGTPKANLITSGLGNFSTISGSVYEDLNNSGILDSGEPGLAGWRVYADINSNGAFDSGEPNATTDSHGSYVLSNLAAGTYTVREVLPSGWAQTSPQAGAYSVTTAAGTAVTGKNFGDFRTLLNVTSTSDSGAGTLRAAIQYANATGGSHTFVFAITGPGPYSIQPQSALPDLAGGANFDVENSDVVQIGVPGSFSLGDYPSLTKIGAGTLVITGAQNHALGAVLNAAAGVLVLNSDAGATAANLSVNANAAVNFGTTQHLSALSIGPNATVSLSRPFGGSQQVLVIGSLSLTPTSDLDLKDNSMIIRGGADPTGTFLAAEAAIKSAFNNFNLNGHGIRSSAIQDATITGLGSMLNSLSFSPMTTFNGQSVNGNDTIVKYTNMGDATLDGSVNDDDVSIAGGFYDNGRSSGRHWFEGDFSHDGVINDDDVSIVSGNYIAHNPPLVPPMAAASAAGKAGSGGAVPGLAAPKPSVAVALPKKDAAIQSPQSIVQRPKSVTLASAHSRGHGIDEDLLDLLAANARRRLAGSASHRTVAGSR